MPFRKLPHIPTSSAQSATEYTYVETQEGNFERVVKKFSALPPCDNFALGKIIDAGVNLEKVSTKIRSTTPPAEFFEPVKDEPKETLSEE